MALTKDGLPASAYLVIEDPEQVSTWHLPIKSADGKADHRLMGAAWAALHSGFRGNKYQGPNKQAAISKLTKVYESEGMAVPTEKSLHIFKQADGEYRWVVISSSAFRDRDGELISVKALADDVARCDESGVYGPLRWFHVGGWIAPDGVERWDTWKASSGVDVGKCDFNMLHGRMLIESGTFFSPVIGKAFSEVADKLEVSIAFSHPPDEPGKNKEYQNIHRFERSLLPAGMASNPLTKVMTLEGEARMKTQDKFAALVAILKGKPEVAQHILADAEAVEKLAEASGMQYKEVEEMLISDEAPAESQEEVPAESSSETTVEATAEVVAEVTAETEATAESKAVAPPKPPAVPPAEEDIGDMTRQDLANFVSEMVRQMMGKKETVEASAKAADNAQLLADAYVSLKAQADRIAALEKLLQEQKTVLDELTDTRPIGIKQMQMHRPTTSLDNVTATVPVGPHLDDSFRIFAQGGK